MMMMEMLLAVQDPVDMLKNDSGFRDWLVYAIGAMVLIAQIKGLLNGDKAKPVHLSGGKVQVEETTRVATLADVEELREELEEFKEENEAQHRAGREAGERRVAAIAEVLEKSGAKMDHAVDRLTERIEQLTAALHEKLNAVTIKTATLEARVDSGEAADFRHEQAVAGLQSLLRSGGKRG